MNVPNAENALVDIRKLMDYCLNPEHPIGQYKAKRFAADLALTAADADSLREILLIALRTVEAELGEKDDYGQRYTVDFTMKFGEAQGIVRSHWLTRTTERFPRWLTCCILEESG